MRLPKIVAAQRLQTWLLGAALVSLVLIGLLVVDLTRNLRSAVISETSRSLINASKELSQAAAGWLAAHNGNVPDSVRADRDLQQVSYEVLRSYPDVEGGFVSGHSVVGHSFPTYTEPGSTLRQPATERAELMAALEASAMTGEPAMRVLHDAKDLVIVVASAGSDGQLSSWCLRRILNFSDSSEINKRLILVAVMVIAFLCIIVVLRLSFSMQRGFAVIQRGLERLQTDASYRLPDQNHELTAIVRSVNSMAEARQKLESDLRREDRLRVMGRVVAGIAHEIRNPLNSIRLTIRVLARRLRAEPVSQEPLALVTSEVDRLDALLKSLLVFREDSLEKVRKQPIQPIIDRTLALVKPHAQEHGVQLRAAVCGEFIALVDGGCLQQALMNLLLNAIDAASRDGMVELAVRERNGSVLVDIEDSGPGLSEEQQEQMFEAFYTTKPSGTGLGLAVTKTLLEKMGATIESVRGARGARFRVTLSAGQAT